MTDPGLTTATLQREGRILTDTLVTEEPLEIRVDGRALAVLMRTPGEDLDLAAGFLASEGVIDGPDDLAALAPCTDPEAAAPENVVLSRLAAGVDAPDFQQFSFAGSGCGVCGKASIDRVFRHVEPLPERVALSAARVAALPAVLRGHQRRFQVTGGLHGAALFDGDQHLLTREDVGRHNAVDKVLGARLRADAWPLDGLILVVSSRAGFEIVQKALAARVAAVVAVGAASSLADRLARAGNLALYSFVRPGGFNDHR